MRTILSTIAVGLIATLVTFSQDSTPTGAEAPEAMTLPANNVEITDVQERTIKASILSKDDKGINIRTADGKEVHVAWNRLNRDTIDKIKGKPTSKPAFDMAEFMLQRSLILRDVNGVYKDKNGNLTEEGRRAMAEIGNRAQEDAMKKIKEIEPKNDFERLYKEEILKSYEINKKARTFRETLSNENYRSLRLKYKDMSVREFKAKLLDDPTGEFESVFRFNGVWIDKLSAAYQKNPQDTEWEKHNISPRALLEKTPDEDPKEEIVTLKPRFLEHAFQPSDVGNANNLALHIICNSTNFAHLEAGEKPITTEQLREVYHRIYGEPQAFDNILANRLYIDDKILECIKHLTTRRPTFLWIRGREGFLPPHVSIAMQKQLLRDGQPVITNSHLIIGYEQKEKTLSWEYIDTNDGSYKKTKQTTQVISDIFGGYATITFK